MTAQRKTVRAFQPTQYEWFDQQFWPIFMALCITAAILAATIISLLDGFWMWISLMILPAAFAIVAFTLRFVDNRRLQRSVQLAVILSLALHCCFLIFAQQTDIFKGLSLVINPDRSAVTQPRVIHVSQNVEQQPWMELNKVETPVPEEPETERIAQVDTSPARPQPTPIQNQQPSEQPQLVRRQQTNRTVPRLGETLSTLSRQTENVQPKSSQPVPRSQPAPATNASPSQPAASSPAASESELARQSRASVAVERPQQASPSQTQRQTETTARRSRSADRPTATPAPSQTRIAQSSPSQPSPTAGAGTPDTMSRRRLPQAEVARQTPSQVARIQRQSPATTERTRNVRANPSPQSSPSQQLAQRRRQDDTSKPSVANQNRLDPARRATNVAAQVESPQPIERPRNESPSTLVQGSANLQPQPMALERSTSGTAGVGRSANVNRDLGSRVSSAITATDSQRRTRASSTRPDPSSFTAQQASRIPRTATQQAMPSSPLSPQSIPLASRAATQQQDRLTANSGAALTSSNSDARRGQVSADKGTGSVDLGPTKIVNEPVNRRVEGGGQPQIQSQPSQQRVARATDPGAAMPSVATPNVNQIASAARQSQGTDQVADDPAPNAQSDLLARDGGAASVSGGPSESTIQGSDPSTSSAFELAENSVGRAMSSEEDDEEDLLRMAGNPARTSTEQPGTSTPDVQVTVNSPGRAAAAPARGTDASLAERAVEVLKRSSGNLPGSGVARATQSALAAAASSMPLMESGTRRGFSQRQTPGEIDSPNSGIQRSTGDNPSASVQPAPTNLASAANNTGTSNQLGDIANTTTLDRDAPPGMALEIDAKTGPVGIGNVVEPNPGVDSRRASRDSPAIQSMTETRFRKNETGGTPSVNPAPVIAKEAFRTRNNPARRRTAPKTEEAIEFGLAFLARYQLEDGSWTLSGFDDDKNDRAVQLSSDTAATGLALLAFQGAGYTHKEFKYSGQLDMAIRWLLEHQQSNGDLYVPMDKKSDDVCRLYSHAIATLALAEAYGMTQDQTLRVPVERALEFISDSQDQRLGGWRYKPGNASDTSVTGWMMMAMQSGKLAGFDTDEKTWIGIQRWLDGARTPDDPHMFRYNPLAVDTATIIRSHGRRPTPCMTSVGLLMRLYTGWNRTDPRLNDGARYLMENLPADSSINVRDTYYWYYATQVLNHVGGETWETWNSHLHPLLIRTQVREGDMAGSWDPLNPVPDRWGAQAGRLYVTAMNLLSLEVDYRLLPLYDDTSE